MDDSTEVPAEYKQAGMFMTLAALVHIMEGMLLGFMGLMTCVGSYGMCCFCPFLGLVPVVVGVMALPAATNARNGVRDPSVRTANMMGLVTAMLCFSMIGVVLEAFVLMQLGNEKVKLYLEERGDLVF